jgi:anthranilate synthase component 2
MLKGVSSSCALAERAGAGIVCAIEVEGALLGAAVTFTWLSTLASCGSARPIYRRNPRLLMIDNYDSFTFNLVQYLGELGQQVKVVRNDALDVAGIRALKPSHIMISPGPGTPDDAGVSLDVLRELSAEIPVFGVCLGHQAIGQAFGGKVIRAKQIMHGKTSPVRHRGQGVFAGLPDPFEATRYHSLVVEQHSLPDCLEVTAWTENPDGSIDEIMGVRHKTLAVEGVQFHPESILTQHGHDLLRNFLGQPLRLAA